MADVNPETGEIEQYDAPYMMNVLNGVESFFDLLSERIPELQDEELDHLYEQLVAIDKFNWRIRAQIVAEKKRRFEERAMRERQTDALDNATIGEINKELAQQFGVNERTIQKDARIFNEILSQGESSRSALRDDGGYDNLKSRKWFEVAVDSATGTGKPPAEWIAHAAAERVKNHEYMPSDLKAEMFEARRNNNPPPPLPADTYYTIEADPPWALDGAEGKSGISAYVVMSTQEIIDMGKEIEALAAPNAHLYLWAINPMLPEALAVMTAWGFEYKTCITWIKSNGFGTGHYFRGQTEHVLFGVKGSLPTMRKDQPTFFEAPRYRHSEKPDEFYDIVETMSPAPRLRLFARSQRAGWVSWGNEVNHDD